ncbi:VWA domain-containing protein [Chitinophaga sp. Hz27]|uniref:vWA domain-containing protein n=1 Tax=Chitinophaga sp. Hz27 TaxID=3347169 RepID=UPI0035DA614A
MKVTLFASAMLLSGSLLWKKDQLILFFQQENAIVAQHPVISSPSAADNTRIQVALLLDTSNSMDGLIDQAKSRLWNIINTLTTLKYKGKTTTIEIALYEYGNDYIPAESGYIRKVTSFTTDLDLISEKLFALTTNGGSEFCGAAISAAVDALEWGRNESDLKLIYIAGNEPFTQGEISYATSARKAVKNNIYVNTIFCGNKQEGISTKWKDGADLGQGKYFNINADKKVVFIETPYDRQIQKCNEKINQTYIAYGAQGASKKMNQVQQDLNANAISAANSAERFVSKSKSVYKNGSWDIVDYAKDDTTVLKKISKKDLPAELQNKTTAEMQTWIKAKSQERDTLQKEMASLGKQRQKFIDEAMKKTNHSDDLGAAISQSIIEQAMGKGYTAEK